MNHRVIFAVSALALSILSVVCAAANVFASANAFVHESERLIAASDETFTVVVTQYDQQPSYFSSKQRLLIRVLDASDNALLSETLISSVLVDREVDEPYRESFSALNEENPSIDDLVIKPQTLFDNLQFPKYTFHIDAEGVYLNHKSRKIVMKLPALELRFPGLRDAVANEDVKFMGWYKMELEDQTRYFLLLKIGLCDCDLDSFEYVFSLPAE